MKALRERLTAAESEGVRYIETENLSRHFRLWFATPSWHTFGLIASSSPSDHRALVKFRADVRRAMRGESKCA